MGVMPDRRKPARSPGTLPLARGAVDTGADSVGKGAEKQDVVDA